MKPKYGVSLPTLAIVVLVAAGARQSTAVPTEQAEAKVPVAATATGKADNDRQAHYIRVRNVSPRTMAWWLDPTHNTEPAEFSSARKMMDLATPLAPANSYQSKRVLGAKLKPEGAFKLPAGVDQIIPVDPQNALLVYGTDEGVRSLQAIVGYLDKPIQQIEIEVQFVEADPEATRAFVDWSNSRPFKKESTVPAPGAFSIGSVRANLQAALKAMAAEGKAKIISAPRVTALNNLTASVYTTTSIPVVVGLKDDKGNFRELRKPAAAATSSASSFYLTTRIGFTVTPTINNDGTITLVMQPAPMMNLTVANDERHALPIATQSVQTIANVRDGDTIVLSGLRTQMMHMENLFVKDEDDVAVKQDGNMILFVTARIVRRAEESKATTPANP